MYDLSNFEGFYADWQLYIEMEKYDDYLDLRKKRQLIPKPGLTSLLILALRFNYCFFNKARRRE